MDWVGSLGAVKYRYAANKMSIDLIGQSLVLERCQSQDYLIHSSHLARAANIHLPKNAFVFAFFHESNFESDDNN